mgnify:CR=1 FL=1
MNNLQIFRNEQFGEVRAIEINGEPWLFGKDVTEILGYQNASKALSDHVDEDDKLNNESLSSLGQRGGWLINESGLYSLILGSKLPQAKQFKKWVTAEVLPSIRKHGGYFKGQETMTDEELLSKALLVAKSQIDEKNKQIEQMRPKEIFADAVATSKTSILIGELAKMLRQNGVEIGQNRLFTWLRDNGYLIKRNGTDYNMPTQSAMEKGLFEIKETVISHSDGHSTVNKTPKVTGKGQQYFINKFLS